MHRKQGMKILGMSEKVQELDRQVMMHQKVRKKRKKGQAHHDSAI